MAKCSLTFTRTTGSKTNQQLQPGWVWLSLKTLSYKSCCHVALSLLCKPSHIWSFCCCPKPIVPFIFRVSIQPAKRHLIFILESAEGFGSINQYFHFCCYQNETWVVVYLSAACLLTLNHCWTTLMKAAVTEPTPANKHLPLASFVHLFSLPESFSQSWREKEVSYRQAPPKRTIVGPNQGNQYCL